MMSASKSTLSLNNLKDLKAWSYKKSYEIAVEVLWIST